MERLTQWIDENRAIPRVDLRRCGHERGYHRQNARLQDGKLHDSVEFEILKEEWRTANDKERKSGSEA